MNPRTKRMIVRGSVDMQADYEDIPGAATTAIEMCRHLIMEYQASCGSDKDTGTFEIEVLPNSAAVTVVYMEEEGGLNAQFETERKI